MPDDLLDAAQKAINDAASSIPQEPAPEPVVPQSPTAEPDKQPQQEPQTPVGETQPVNPAPAAPAPVPQAPEPTPSVPHIEEEKLVVPPDPSTQTPPPPQPKGKSSISGAIIGVIALLLLALPAGVYFISQRDQQLADVRSRAADGTYSCNASTPCTGGKICIQGQCTAIGDCNPNNPDGRGGCTNPAESCSCPPGGTCTCTPTGGQDACYHTICPPQYHCVGSGPGAYCVPDKNGDDDTPTPRIPKTPTPTTSTTVHQCLNIKMWKNGAEIDPSTVTPGDTVVLSVTGNGTPSKARFRVNGGTWQETTTAGNSAGTYTLSYTIPEGITDFQIEAEVFVDGAWK